MIKIITLAVELTGAINFPNAYACRFAGAYMWQMDMRKESDVAARVQNHANKVIALISI